MPLAPTNELVVESWLAGVVGLTSSMVATTLPKDSTAWAAKGFVQVVIIGGTPDIDVPIRRPLVQLDFWATGAGTSTKPPWNLAAGLAELVRTGVEFQQYGQLVTTREGYFNARVLSAIMRTEPRRVEGDPSGYARYSADVELHWTRLQSQP